MRLGDYIDDHCSRCKRYRPFRGGDGWRRGGESALPHLQFRHKYRHNSTGKKEMTKEEAFQKVLPALPASSAAHRRRLRKVSARKR